MKEMPVQIIFIVAAVGKTLLSVLISRTIKHVRQKRDLRLVELNMDVHGTTNALYNQMIDKTKRALPVQPVTTGHHREKVKQKKSKEPDTHELLQTCHFYKSNK